MLICIIELYQTTITLKVNICICADEFRRYRKWRKRQYAFTFVERIGMLNVIVLPDVYDGLFVYIQFMKIESLLSTIGMKQIEQKIYLNLLQYNSLSAGTIAKFLKKPRSTVYGYLEKMIDENFITQSQSSGGAVYASVDVEQIILILEKKKKNISKTITTIQEQKYLLKEYKSDIGLVPKIRIHEWQDALSILQSSTEFDWWYFMRDIDALHHGLGWNMDEIIQNFHNKKQKNQKSIMIDSKASRKYKKHIEWLSHNTHQIKFLPPNRERLFSDSMMINNIYFHITYKNPVIAIEINNPTFFETQKLIFETIWDSL